MRRTRGRGGDAASTVPVSVHLDHAEDTELIRRALDLGYDSIMYDGSKLEYSQNIAISKAMVELAHSYGATIEVELGEIGGKDGVVINNRRRFKGFEFIHLKRNGSKTYITVFR